MKHIARICIAVALVAQRCRAEDYDVAKLIDLAPNVAIGSPLVTSFSVHAESAAAQTTFDVTYARPGQVAIRLTDSSDGTPVLIAIGRDALIYDASQGRVIAGRTKSISFYIKGDFAKKTVLCAAFIDEDSLDTVNVDIRSVLGIFDASKVSSVDNLNFDVSGVSPSGNIFHSFFAPRDMVPFKAFYVSAPDQSVLLKLNPIEINRPIAPATWEFPSEKQRAGLATVPLGPWLQDGKATKTLLASVPTIQFRAAIRDAKLREMWEKAFGKVDWQFAARKDAEMSAQLRKLFKALPPNQ